MKYHELYESAQFLHENGVLHNNRSDYIHDLYHAGVNYLDYAHIDEQYISICALVEHIYHNHHDLIDIKDPSILIFKGMTRKLERAFKHLNQIKEPLALIEKQVFMAGLLSLQRVKHTASQFGIEQIQYINISHYDKFIAKHKSSFPHPVEGKTALLAIARMNRFVIIHQYLVDKFRVRYSARVPRLDDYCKLLAAIHKSATSETLQRYLNRYDTAKFMDVSVYSPWNICYYQCIRNALASIPTAALKKQYNAYIARLKKIDTSKIDEDELVLYKEVKKVTKLH